MRRRSSITADLGLTSDSFTDEIPEVEQRITVNVEAKEKEGKTTWALKAPGPLIVYNADQGLEGVIQRFRDKGKQITVAGYPGSARGKRLPHYRLDTKPPKAKGERSKTATYTQKVANICRPIWKKFVEDYYEGLNSKARTLVMDTGTGLWLLARYAYWGAVSPPHKNLAGSIKEEFSALVVDALNYDKNVIWLHRLRPEWTDVVLKDGTKDSIKTSRWERSGHTEMGYDVQANVRLVKETVGKRDPKIVYKTQVIDCRLNATLDGEELEGKMCSFPFFASMVFGNEVEEWE